MTRRRNVFAGLQYVVLMIVLLACVTLAEFSIQGGFIRRRLDQDIAEAGEESLQKTIFYLVFFSLMGTSLFCLQRAILNMQNQNAFVVWLRTTSIISLCCLPPQKSKKSPDEDDDHELDILVTSDKEPRRRKEDESSQSAKDEEDEFNLGTLSFCICGLLVSYILWGFFQERLMTRPYDSISTGDEDKFVDAEFLVFCNRLLGLFAGLFGVYYTGPHSNFAPPFSFAFCSMSNILSSWFQYESLKFITFPMQVLSKSCKIIATMLMGYFLLSNSYSGKEILNAGSITIGLFVFKWGQSSAKTDDEEMGEYFFLGMILIGSYIFCDAFTSNWQQRIFKEYKVHQFQMMAGVNIFSTSFSGLLCAPKFFSVFAFCADHPACIFHIICMSCCSAVGQLFIFYTIKKFGAVVFATAMVSRSIISVLLSIALFNHTITAVGAFGMAISFGGLICKVYLKYDKSQKKKLQKQKASPEINMTSMKK